MPTPTQYSPEKFKITTVEKTANAHSEKRNKDPSVGNLLWHSTRRRSGVTSKTKTSNQHKFDSGNEEKNALLNNSLRLSSPLPIKNVAPSGTSSFVSKNIKCYEELFAYIINLIN